MPEGNADFHLAIRHHRRNIMLYLALTFAVAVLLVDVSTAMNQHPLSPSMSKRIRVEYSILNYSFIAVSSFNHFKIYGVTRSLVQTIAGGIAVTYVVSQAVRMLIEAQIL